MSDNQEENKCFDAQSIFDTWIFSNDEGTITIKQNQHGEEILVIIPGDCVESVVYMLRSARKEI